MTAPVSDGQAPLNPVEQLLIDHIERGELLDLAGDEPVDEAAMRSWDESRTVSAAVIRDIVRGRLAPNIDPHGLRLRGARITGRIDLENITASTLGIELYDCLLEKGLNARGTTLADLTLIRCHLEHDSGPALDAENLIVDRNVFLNGKFDATGAGELGTIRLVSAHIGGVLDCADAHLRNDSGPALQAENLIVEQHVFLLSGFDAVGDGTDVVVNLIEAKVGGILAFQPARLEHRSDPASRLWVDGLTYSGLPQGMPSGDWLNLLRTATPRYAAQPYQHLAAAHRAAGHDGEARKVLRTQRHDQIHRKALTGHTERTWARFTGLTLGYGYQPWRALLGLAAAVITAVILAIILGGHGGLTQVRTPPPPNAQTCTVIERIGYGLDLGTPLLTTGARTRCDTPTTPTTTGNILTITGWTLKLLAWAFATLFIAGFTGAVRKT